MLRFEVLSPADALRLRRVLVISLCLLLPLLYLAAGSAGVLPLPAFLAGDGMGALWCALAQLALTLPVCWLGRGLFAAAMRELRAKAPGAAALAALGVGLALAGGLLALALTAWGAADGDIALVRQYRGGGCFAAAAGALTLTAAARLLAAHAAARLAGLPQPQTPATACVLRGSQAVDLPAAELQPGEVFYLRPGETASADGVVLEGRSRLNEAALTGRAAPADKAPGDAVFAGAVNGQGTLACRATRVGPDTTQARLADRLRQADPGQPADAAAARACTLLVQAALGLALAALLVWLLLGQTLPFALLRAAAVLLFGCPCVFGLAAPAVFLAGRTAGLRQGALFTAAGLGAAADIDTVLVDKATAIVSGEPCVVEVVGTRNVPPKFLLGLAAGLETGSRHPLAKAVLQKADADGVSHRPAAELQAVPGLGLLGKVAGKVMAGGTEEFIRSQCPLPDDLAAAGKRLAAAGATPLYFALDRHAAGVIGVADAVQPHSKAAVARLKALGLRVVLLTGDTPAYARYLAGMLGLDPADVAAGLAPADLPAEVARRRAAGRVAMAGGDSPCAEALAGADLGAALYTGAVALPDADLLLLTGDLADLPAAVQLARRAAALRRRVQAGALCFHAVGGLLAAGVLAPLGLLPGPMFAAACLCLACLGVAACARRLLTPTPPASPKEELP